MYGLGYGHDQFSASQGDPYFDMNDLKYNTRPSETIQMSTPMDAHIRTSDMRQQASALKCEETLLQIRNNNDNMLEMYKALVASKKKDTPPPQTDTKESFFTGEMPDKQVNQIIMYLLLFIVVLMAVLLIQFQNIGVRMDSLEELSKLILLLKKNNPTVV